MRLYPEEVRRRYAEEMVRYFGDLCREEWHSRGAKGMVLLWARTLPDLLFSLLKERGTWLLMSAHHPEKPLILLGFAVIFVVISLYPPPRYVAQTGVRVNPKPQSEILSKRELNELTNYGYSRPVAEGVVEALKLQMGPDELRRNLSAGAVADRNWGWGEVVFAYSAHDLREAEMISREAASVFVSHVTKDGRKASISRPAASVYASLDKDGQKALIRGPVRVVLVPQTARHLLYALSGVLMLGAILTSGLPRLLWAGVALGLPSRVGRRLLNPSEAENLKEAELLLALGRCGPLSAAGVAHETSLPIEEAEQMLDALTIKGHIQVTVEHGRLLYALWEHDAPL
jgi:hypothetical protein